MEKRVYSQVGETLYHGRLENGLAIYVMPKPAFSQQYAFFATDYGGADRRFQLDGTWQDTPAGIAHFLEHKLFDTEKGNALADLAANGASPNAFTSAEMTAYYFTCANGFFDNLRTLLDFVSVPYFTAESVEKEQGIIGQEIGMIEDTPGYVVYYNLLKCLYAKHPVRDTIAGTVDSIAQITAETLYNCHHVFYRPSNMVLCVVGDVDPQRVWEIAEDVLPGGFAPPPIMDYGVEDTLPVASGRREVTMEVSQPLFIIGSRGPAGLTGECHLRADLIGSLAAKYLAGKSSPLYLDMYARGLVTADFSCGFSAGQSFAITEFSGESRSPDEVLDALRAEITGTMKQGIDLPRFTRLKKAFSGKLIRSLDSAETLCYEQTAAHFNHANALDRFAVLDSIMPDDVLGFIKETLNPERLAISVVNGGQVV